MDVDDMIYQYNKRMVLESLQSDEVDSYTRAHEISDSRALHTR